MTGLTGLTEGVDATLFCIKNWSTLYENHRTRELKKVNWVAVPNAMHGDGYTELLDHPNGTAHYAAWIAILLIASRCEVRGVLSRDDGRPHTPQSLARMSRIPAAFFEEAFPRLVQVGWLEVLPAEGATPARESATPARESAHVGKGIVGKGTGGQGIRAAANPPAVPKSNARPFPVDPPPADGALRIDDFIEERWARHPAPKRRDRPLAENEISSISGIETAVVQQKFREGHESHITSEDWQWKDGVKAQTLAQFASDGNWKYSAPKPPAREGQADAFAQAAAEAIKGRKYK